MYFNSKLFMANLKIRLSQDFFTLTLNTALSLSVMYFQTKSDLLICTRQQLYNQIPFNLLKITGN